MRALAEFQQRFSVALMSGDATLEAHVGAALTVHRNTAMKGLVDALTANYPVVEQLLGRECFRTLAQQYARAHLPQQAALNLYGASFASFLAGQDTLAEFPYVPAVAQLERCWIEAYFSADQQPLDAHELAAVDPASLLTLQLPWHPAARIAWLPASALRIWQHHQHHLMDAALEVSLAEQGVLITRPQAAMVVSEISADEYQFLQAARRQPLGAAAMQLLQQDASADVAGMLAKFINAGVFSVFPDFGKSI